MPAAAIVAIVGVAITTLSLLAAAFYRIGHISARVEELEREREAMRQYMHEISERLEDVARSLQQLSTIIEERTVRRVPVRDLP